LKVGSAEKNLGARLRRTQRTRVIRAGTAGNRSRERFRRLLLTNSANDAGLPVREFDEELAEVPRRPLRRRPPRIQRFACSTRTAHLLSMSTLTSLALARRWRYGYPRLSAAGRKMRLAYGLRAAPRTKAIAKFAVRSSKRCTSDYADCARLRTRLLISANSETSARVF
jgi:hypothetical protein